MAVKSLARTLSRISLGLVLVLVWMWMYLRADVLFPNNPALKETFLIYIIFTAFIFSWDTAVSRQTEQPMFRIPFVKVFPKFLIFSGIGLLVLFIASIFLKSNALPSIQTAITSIGFGVIILHALFVSIMEEKVFRNWLPRNLKRNGISKGAVWFLSALIFALFHYFLGREILQLVIYIPLGYLLMWVQTKYSPKTDMANSGIHFAWNIFILGFLV